MKFSRSSFYLFLSRHHRAAACAALTTIGALLSGCSPAMQSIGDITHMSGIAMAGHFDPRYRYLRVTVNGRAVPMVLGFVDGPSESPTDIWYSSAHEVLRLRDGMVTGTAGMPVNWVDVRYSAWPSWAVAAQTIERRRDVQPGYRFGLHDTLRIEPIAPPSSSRLQGIDPASLRWFRVTETTGPQRQRTMLYAVRGTQHARVIYGEQCLNEQLCLTWQVWPPAVR